MGKEILISKSELLENFNRVLIGLLYSIVIMLLITVIFESFKVDNAISRLGNSNYYGQEVYYYYYNSFLEQQYSGYDSTYGWRLQSLSVKEKLFNYYLPFVVIENYSLLIIITIIVAITLKLSSFFTIKFK